MTPLPSRGVSHAFRTIALGFVSTKVECCYQLMETHGRMLLEE